VIRLSKMQTNYPSLRALLRAWQSPFSRRNTMMYNDQTNVDCHALRRARNDGNCVNVYINLVAACSFITLLFTNLLYAQDPSFSLFLTQEEQSQFNQDPAHPLLPWPSNKLTLKAIMMLDENHWTIWLNEHKITPESCPDHVEVVSVTSESVNLVWSTEQGPKTIQLKVRETIDLSDDEKQKTES